MTTVDDIWEAINDRKARQAVECIACRHRAKIHGSELGAQACVAYVYECLPDDGERYAQPRCEEHNGKHYRGWARYCGCTVPYVALAYPDRS